MGSGEGRGEAPLGDRPLTAPPAPCIPQLLVLSPPQTQVPHGPPLYPPGPGSITLTDPGPAWFRPHVSGPSQLSPSSPWLHPLAAPWPSTATWPLPSSPRSPHGLTSDSPLAPAQPLTVSPAPGFIPFTGAGPTWLSALQPPWSPIATYPQPSSHYSPHGPEPYNPHHFLAQLSPSQPPAIPAPSSRSPRCCPAPAF